MANNNPGNGDTTKGQSDTGNVPVIPDNAGSVGRQSTILPPDNTDANGTNAGTGAGQTASVKRGRGRPRKIEINPAAELIDNKPDARPRQPRKNPLPVAKAFDAPLEPQDMPLPTAIVTTAASVMPAIFGADAAFTEEEKNILIDVWARYFRSINAVLSPLWTAVGVSAAIAIPKMATPTARAKIGKLLRRDKNAPSNNRPDNER